MPPGDDTETELVRTYAPAIRRLAASYERDLASRDDLVQDILFAIVRALPTWRRKCSERTFVYRVAHNRAASHIAKRRLPVVDVAAAANVPDPSLLPEQLASASQERETLYAALRRLPVAHRRLLTMALDGLTTREIGEVLGITDNNVAVRLTRARTALRELLPPRQEP